MREVRWRCDNRCGAQEFAERRPDGWGVVNHDDRALTLCGPKCLAEWAWKVANGVPVETPVTLSADIDEREDGECGET